MPPAILRVLLRALWPGLVPVLVALVWLTSEGAPQEVSGGLSALRYGAIGLAVLVGWRFHRSRVIFATLTLALGAEAIFALGASADSPVGAASPSP